MREKGAWSETTYKSRAATVASVGRGTATYEGEERVRQGKGLDSLVDPKERGVIRVAGNLLVAAGDVFELKFGVAMPGKTDIDTTGSMGGNVDIAFRVQPKVQNLLIQGKNAVLKRYHTQLATGVVQDRVDRFPYQVSQFEPDNEVERQMGLLVPERSGADPTEDYQLGLFSTAYLTETAIVKYGLKGYYFSVGDQQGRDEFDDGVLRQVFGSKVFELAKLSKDSLPSTDEVAKKLLSNWHGFFLQVGKNRYVTEWWSRVLGRERVIALPRTELMAEVQAVVIGLTEGVLDLKSAVDFLKEAKVSVSDAKAIVEACGQIPVGLQASLPNFDKIPLAGAKFASRDDIWPIGTKGASAGKAEKPAKGKKAPPAEGDKKNWKI